MKLGMVWISLRGTAWEQSRAAVALRLALVFKQKPPMSGRGRRCARCRPGPALCKPTVEHEQSIVHYRMQFPETGTN
jgi:hypothetical protein